MKYLLILLLLIPCVYAGQIIHADLVNNDFAFVTLAERDMVDFVYNNSVHRLMIRELDLNKKAVKLTFFMANMENPLYTTISDKLKLQIDFEKDGFNDMNVWFVGMEEGNVTLKLEKIHEEKQKDDKTTKQSILDRIKQINFKRLYSEKFGIGLIISILILVILLSNRRWIRRKFRRVKRRLF